MRLPATSNGAPALSNGTQALDALSPPSVRAEPRRSVPGSPGSYLLTSPTASNPLRPSVRLSQGVQGQRAACDGGRRK